MKRPKRQAATTTTGEGKAASGRSLYGQKRASGNMMYGPGCCAHKITAKQIETAKEEARVRGHFRRAQPYEVPPGGSSSIWGV